MSHVIVWLAVKELKNVFIFQYIPVQLEYRAQKQYNKIDILYHWPISFKRDILHFEKRKIGRMLKLLND